jgi:hypothetical protein
VPQERSAAVRSDFMRDVEQHLSELTSPLRSALEPPDQVVRIWSDLPRLWLHGIIAIERLETARLVWFSAPFAATYDQTTAALGARLLREATKDAALMALCRLLDRSGPSTFDIRKFSDALDAPLVLQYRHDVAKCLGIGIQCAAADSNRRVLAARLRREKIMGRPLSAVVDDLLQIRRHILAHGVYAGPDTKALKTGDVRCLAVRSLALLQSIFWSATLTRVGPLRDRGAIRHDLHSYLQTVRRRT